jgi:hypothetical protein
MITLPDHEKSREYESNFYHRSPGPTVSLPSSAI